MSTDPHPSDESATPAVPPPDAAKYTPPPPSLPPVTAPVPSDEPVIRKPDVPTPEEARKIHLKVAKEEVDESTLDGAAAPFNTRMIAAVIDVVVVIGVQIAMAFIPFIGSKLAWPVGIAYLLTRDCLPFLGGQSVGKKAMGIKALTTDGKTLLGNWQPGVIRNVVLLIPLFGFVEIFILLTREDKAERGLRLGDEWAKTKVVIHKPELADENAPEPKA